MIGFATYAEKAIAAVERNRAELARAERRLADHDAAAHANDDADVTYSRKRERRDLEDRVEAAREALTFAENRAEQARAEQAEREIDARNKAANAASMAQEKLIAGAVADIERAASKIRQSNELQSAIDAANAERGARPFIVDGETKLRSQPGALVPARVVEDSVWADDSGDVVPPQIKDADDRWVNNPAARQIVTRTNVLSPEYRLPPVVPTRLVEALRLVDLAGNPLPLT